MTYFARLSSCMFSKRVCYFVYSFLQFFVICVYIDSITIKSYAQTANKTDETKTFQRSPLRLLVVARGGAHFGMSAKEFFEIYTSPRIGFGMQTSDFPTPLGASVSAKVPFTNWRFGIDVDYLQTKVVENRSVPVYTNPYDINNTTTIGQRNQAHSIGYTALPILLTAEHIPFTLQFKNYLGVGVGVSFIDFSWNETLVSTIAQDKRVGGNLYRNSSIVPALRLYTGIELGFDSRRSRDRKQSALVMEFRYTFMPYYAQPYDESIRQFSVPTSVQPLFQKDYLIGASSVSIQIGLQFDVSSME